MRSSLSDTNKPERRTPRGRSLDFRLCLGDVEASGKRQAEEVLVKPPCLLRVAAPIRVVVQSLNHRLPPSLAPRLARRHSATNSLPCWARPRTGRTPRSPSPGSSAPSCREVRRRRAKGSAESHSPPRRTLGTRRPEVLLRVLRALCGSYTRPYAAGVGFIADAILLLFLAMN